jgi:hypothetical protein
VQSALSIHSLCYKECGTKAFLHVGKYLPKYTASSFVVVIFTATTILETSFYESKKVLYL